MHSFKEMGGGREKTQKEREREREYNNVTIFHKDLSNSMVVIT